MDTAQHAFLSTLSARERELAAREPGMSGRDRQLEGLGCNKDRSHSFSM